MSRCHRKCEKKETFKNLKVCNTLTVKGQTKQIHKIRKLSAEDVKRRALNGAPEERYDVIVVGAGTAGSVLIYRLAERYPTAKVLVVETGQDDVRINTGNAVVPNPNPGNGTGFDSWGQLLRSIASAFGEGCHAWLDEIKTTTSTQLFRTPVGYTRGATLGGTSAINGYGWNRGTREGTYDFWEEATGEANFGFDAMNQSFKSLEDRGQTNLFFSQPIKYWQPSNVAPNQAMTFNAQYMGLGGPVKLTQPYRQGYVSRAINEAISSAPLPGRTAPLPINISDVAPSPGNPEEYGWLFPENLYDQSDPTFPTYNPYGPIFNPSGPPTPGTTYVPPNDPGNAKGPEYAGNGPKSLTARGYSAPTLLYPVIDKIIPNNVTLLQRAYFTGFLFSECDNLEVIGIEYVTGPNGEGWHVAEKARAVSRFGPPYDGTLSGSGAPGVPITRQECTFDAALRNQQNVVTHRAYAKTDIWLCSGSIDNPAFLQRAGIADQQFLESLNVPIPLRLHLPGVGRGVRDTFDAYIGYKTEVDFNLYDQQFPYSVGNVFYGNYYAFADPTNPLDPAGTASIAGSQVQNLSTLRVKADLSRHYPDTLLTASFFGLVPALPGVLWQEFVNYVIGQGVNLKLDEMRPNVDVVGWGKYSPIADPTYLQDDYSLIQYFGSDSNGEVSISSADPFRKPIYAPNMGANERDLEALSNMTEQTILPIHSRIASKRYGPRGPWTYLGDVSAATNNNVTLSTVLTEFRPIVGDIDQVTYDMVGSLNNYKISIIEGTGSGQNNVITSWTGAPNYIATVLVPWGVVPDNTSKYTLNPPNSTPVDSVEFDDNNFRNFVRHVHPSGDILYNTVVLRTLNNAMTTSAKSTRVTINLVNHGFKTGDMIKISGVVGQVDNIDAYHFNDYHVAYRVDDDNFDIILFWNRTRLGTPTFIPNPAENAVGASNVGGTFEVHSLRFAKEKFRHYLEEHYATSWHACRSMKMGVPEDNMAVVDTRGRVYGIKGLRASDASIFPVKPNGNTMAPAMGITQRLFELVSTEEYDYLLSL